MLIICRRIRYRMKFALAILLLLVSTTFTCKAYLLCNSFLYRLKYLCHTIRPTSQTCLAARLLRVLQSKAFQRLGHRPCLKCLLRLLTQSSPNFYRKWKYEKYTSIFFIKFACESPSFRKWEKFRKSYPWTWNANNYHVLPVNLKQVCPSNCEITNLEWTWASTPLEHWGVVWSSAEDARIEAP